MNLMQKLLKIIKTKQKKRYTTRKTILFGDAVSDIMIEADIATDIVFSVTNSDEINTLVSILSKKLGAKIIYHY